MPKQEDMEGEGTAGLDHTDTKEDNHVYKDIHTAFIHATNEYI